MNKYYSIERNAQTVLALLKAHGIKRVIASPGSTNVCMVGSMQNDPYFEMYSCIDERSAAYMAVGMARETGEPVVLSCTGATSSRNYMPALTEAYYSKLPLIVITSSQRSERIGHLITQVTDRRTIPADIVKISVQVPVVKLNDDMWNCRVQVDKALTEARREGGGPVHINLETNYSRDFSVKELPVIPVIKRIEIDDEFPQLPEDTKIAILIGCHRNFTKEETEKIDCFCAAYNAVVLCEMTSGYHGCYGVVYDLMAAQQYSYTGLKSIGLMIHIGEVAGADFSMDLKPENVWRVHPDGEIKDPFRKLSFVFQMSESRFFTYYTSIHSEKKQNSLYNYYHNELKNLRVELEKQDLPLSNIWMATQMYRHMPENSEIHVGIMNSFRAWNLVELPSTVQGYCNVGGYGIDGCVSSMVGASLVNPDKLYFGVYGDLAFFYDINILGNHHLRHNVRILLVNNGRGNEFHNDSQTWENCFTETEIELFGSAAGHFGCKSPLLVKNFAENLGFEYLTASSKEEFNRCVEYFLDPKPLEKPIIFEVFTIGSDESRAFHMMRNLRVDTKEYLKDMVKKTAVKIVGEDKARLTKSIFLGD